MILVDPQAQKSVPGYIPCFETIDGIPDISVCVDQVVFVDQHTRLCCSLFWDEAKHILRFHTLFLPDFLPQLSKPQHFAWNNV